MLSRRYFVFVVILILVTSNNLFVANAGYTEVDGGVYGVSTINPETSGTNGLFLRCMASLSVSVFLIKKK